jgi:rhamnogalacturonyl hydrolase YesR
MGSKTHWRFARLCRAGVICFSFSVLALAQMQPRQFRNWPAGTSPQEVGKRVAERFLAKVNLSTSAAIYPSVCAWYGALNFAQLSADKALTARLVERFEAQATPDISALVRDHRHVDYSVLGAVPFEIYMQTRQARYLDAGKIWADRQWEDPTPEGLSAETRFWIDDMYMITLLQVQAYRATGNEAYINRAATEMVAYLDKLQQPNGLFYHAPDVPFFWGRGNGWVAAGMTELLRSLPANHPLRPRVLASYRKMMASLLRFQGKDGMWRQLIDHPEAWAESSSTAMFTFAMITGVKNGWLPEKAYAKAARKGWLGLVSYLNSDGDVNNVCEGTGKKNDLDYYLQRARLTGDFHGQAPILWCASALLR